LFKVGALEMDMEMQRKVVNLREMGTRMAMVRLGGHNLKTTGANFPLLVLVTSVAAVVSIYE